MQKDLSMTAKLTLSVEKETIEKAKALSSKTGKSISKMFEEYLDSLVDNKPRESAVKKISGLLKGKAPENMDWKEVKAAYLKEKYGL